MLFLLLDFNPFYSLRWRRLSGTYRWDF